MRYKLTILNVLLSKIAKNILQKEKSCIFFLLLFLIVISPAAWKPQKYKDLTGKTTSIKHYRAQVKNAGFPFFLS